MPCTVSLFPFSQSKSEGPEVNFTLVFSFSGEGIGGAGLGDKDLRAFFLLAPSLSFYETEVVRAINQIDFPAGFFLSFLHPELHLIWAHSLLTFRCSHKKGRPREDLWDWEYCAKQHIRIMPRKDSLSKVRSPPERERILFSYPLLSLKDQMWTLLDSERMVSTLVQTKENGSSGRSWVCWYGLRNLKKWIPDSFRSGSSAIV